MEENVKSFWQSRKEEIREISPEDLEGIVQRGEKEAEVGGGGWRKENFKISEKVKER